MFCGSAEAIGRRHRYNGQPKTEVELMNKVLECLRDKDTFSYYSLFPPFDSLWKMVTHNPDQSPETQKELNKLRDHPTIFLDLDPYYNHAIIGRFVEALKKGEDSGIQWKGIVSQRFELQRQEQSRGMEGLQHVIPERFKGFLFVRDMLSSTTYCITITEIQKINGFYCGGQVLNVLEASDIDQYIKREREERRYLAKLARIAEQQKFDSVKADSTRGMSSADSVKADSTKTAIAKAAAPAKPVDTLKAKRDLLLSVAPAEDDTNRTRREVVDRKYYKGKFDDEIPVELYVRYMKDVGSKVTKYWDALYKFGDMSEYVKLDVSKNEEAKWLFEEPIASMELELNGKIYTGAWTNGENQTGYDAELSQKEISQKKIMELDKILENGLWGKTNEQKIAEKDDKGKNVDNDKSGSRKSRREQRQKEREKEDGKKDDAGKDKKDDSKGKSTDKDKNADKDAAKPDKKGDTDKKDPPKTSDKKKEKKDDSEDEKKDTEKKDPDAKKDPLSDDEE